MSWAILSLVVFIFFKYCVHIFVYFVFHIPNFLLIFFGFLRIFIVYTFNFPYIGTNFHSQSFMMVSFKNCTKCDENHFMCLISMVINSGKGHIHKVKTF